MDLRVGTTVRHTVYNYDNDSNLLHSTLNRRGSIRTSRIQACLVHDLRLEVGNSGETVSATSSETLNCDIKLRLQERTHS